MLGNDALSAVKMIIKSLPSERKKKRRIDRNEHGWDEEREYRK
jgi:hypothetical protein